ncbi:MAG: type II toxin-antitoxin system RelE/ParE family toxin [Clostridia bacterium]|nr:type II toxin-antitoxin system RelE/ParE family toxin [Clostridia bacterium]
MEYKLIVSKEAHNDIDDIVNYIALKLANPTAAASFLDDVEKSYYEVINKPRMYSLCQDVRLSREGYRRIVIKNYLILYRIDDDAKAIHIVRIIYSGRNYSELI